MGRRHGFGTGVEDDAGQQAWLQGFVAFPPLHPVLFETALHCRDVFIDDRGVFSRKRFSPADDLASVNSVLRHEVKRPHETVGRLGAPIRRRAAFADEPAAARSSARHRLEFEIAPEDVAHGRRFRFVDGEFVFLDVVAERGVRLAMCALRPVSMSICRRDAISASATRVTGPRLRGRPIFSGRLAEFGQEVDPALVGYSFVSRRVRFRPEVGLGERVLDRLAASTTADRRSCASVRPWTDPHQGGDIVRLAGQGLSKEARGLGDEVGVQRLQLGLFGFAMRAENLRRCVSHVVANDVRPPMIAPARAANAEI